MQRHNQRLYKVLTASLAVIVCKLMGKKIGLWSQSLFRVFFKEIISIWVQNRSLFLQLPLQTHLFFYCFMLFTGQRLQRLYTDNNLIWSDHTSTVRLHSHTSHKGLGNRHNELISETETSAYKQIRAQSGGDVILLHIKPPTPLHAALLLLLLQLECQIASGGG